VLHAVVAAVSSLAVQPALVAVFFVAAGLPLNEMTHTFPALWRPLAFLLASSTIAGLAILPLRKLAWYWAAILGPIIAVATLGAFYFAYEGIMDQIYDPEA
jgi:hypothetical protein